MSRNTIIELDRDGQPVQPILVLATKSGEKIGVISNVTGLSYSVQLNGVDEISFSVNKEADGQICDLWERIVDFKLVYMPQLNEWFEIEVKLNEANETVKSVTGTHAQEAELSQRLLFETEINTEDDIARDDYVVTKFYNPDNPKGSLLHRILADKCQDYSIEHVDTSLRDLQRTFNFNQKSVKAALDEIAEEVECLFVYGEKLVDDNKLHRTISAYDLLDYCTECGERGTFTNGRCSKCNSPNIIKGYGEDTHVYISKENVTTSVTLKSNADKVKNCFRLEAGDDVMTAVVRSINPSSSQYIWYFSDETRNDMSDELHAKLDQYDALYEQYQNTQPMNIVPPSSIGKYNALVNKYNNYIKDLKTIDSTIVGTTNLVAADYNARYLYSALKTTMMPGSTDVEDTTAQEQVAKLTVANLSPVGIEGDRKLANVSKATADSAIITRAKLFVDTSRYRVTIEDGADASTYTNPYWRGKIRCTSYRDDDDTAVTGRLTIEFSIETADYVKDSIQKTIDKMEAQKLGAVTLFEMDEAEFKAELNKYSLSYLGILRDACTACIDIMIEQGIPQDKTKDLYNQVYKPYYDKSKFIEKELVEREGEIAQLLAPNKDAPLGLIDYIEKQRNAIKSALDMYNFLGSTLWQELMAYRRDDVYRNQNYISDGLTDSELIENAQKFYDVANKEILKSATLQNSISGKLQNFLLMPEFRDIVDYIKVGNKIFLGVDDKVYQLRLISCEIDYDKIENINITFADVIKAGDVVSDTLAILNQAKSMATSYDATQRQADKGSAANSVLRNWVLNGLDLTTKKIVNAADNQNMIFDSTGLYMRRKYEYEADYSPEQVKIINQGLFYTTNAWETSKAGIGHYKYIDPTDGSEKDGYGVIADTVVGNLFLGHDVRIYSTNNNVTINEDGAIFTLKHDKESNTGLFKIQSEDEHGDTTDLIYVDANNKLIIATWQVFAKGLFAQHTITEIIPTTIPKYDPVYVYDADGEAVYLTVDDGTITSGTVQTTYGKNGGTVAGYTTYTYVDVVTEGDEDNPVYYPVDANGDKLQDISDVDEETIETTTTRTRNLSSYSGMFSSGDTAFAVSMTTNPNTLSANSTVAQINTVTNTGQILLKTNGSVVSRHLEVNAGTGRTFVEPSLIFTRLRPSNKSTYAKMYLWDSDTDPRFSFAVGTDASSSSTHTYVVTIGKNGVFPYANNARYLGWTDRRWLGIYGKTLNLSGNATISGTTTTKNFSATGTATIKGTATVGNLATSGAILVTKTNYNTTTTPSSGLFNSVLTIQDKNSRPIGYIQAAHTAANSVGLMMQGRRKIGSTEYKNQLALYVNSSGSAVVTVEGTDADRAWRNAIGVNNTVNKPSISSKNVSNSTDTTLGNTGSLAPGTYLIHYGVSFDSSSTGRRAMFLSNSTSGGVYNSHRITIDACSSSNTEIADTILVTLTSATTLYLRVWQNSGSTLSVSGQLATLLLHET